MTGFRHTMRGRREPCRKGRPVRELHHPGASVKSRSLSENGPGGQQSRSDVWEGMRYWKIEFFGQRQAGSLDLCSSAMDRRRQRLAACRPARARRRLQTRPVSQVPKPSLVVPPTAFEAAVVEGSTFGANLPRHDDAQRLRACHDMRSGRRGGSELCRPGLLWRAAWEDARHPLFSCSQSRGSRPTCSRCVR
jgi:hypothetical protein